MKNNKNIEKIETRYRNIISIDSKHIDANSIKSLMNNFDLQIPAYQRPYSWTKKNIEQLLTDLCNQVNYYQDYDYFLGMIFTLEKNSDSDQKEYEIVDGQQRLTTILILLIYLKLTLDKKDKYDDFINEINHIKLVSMSEKDNLILSQMNKFDTLYSLLNFLNEQAKEAKKTDLFFFQQISIFRSAMKTFKKFFKNDDNLRQKIFQYVFEKVKVLHIISRPNDLIGDQFFSSLNGKGLQLDQVDLLKSSFIHPYIKTKKDINDFKEKWSKLIKNTKNDMLKKINNYFSSMEDNMKIAPSKLNDAINKRFDTDEKMKKAFEKMCIFFDNFSTLIDANTKSPKINFYVKLNKKFNFDNYEKVIFTSIFNTTNYFSNTEDFSLEKRKNLETLEKILEILFKINFIYLTILEYKPSMFIENVIDKYVKSKNTANEICSRLNKQLDDILKGSDVNINDKFKNLKFEDVYDTLYYDKSKKNKNKIIFLLNLIFETYSNDTKDLEYGKACSMVDYQIEHRVQKAEKKSRFIDENGKVNIPWKTSKDDDKKIIFFENDYFDIFQDNEFKTKYNIKEHGMLFENFIDMLNHPFNLKLLEKSDNQHKSSNNWLTKDELCNHFSIINENKVKDNFVKAWNWIIYSKFCKNNTIVYSYIDIWKKIENFLKQKLIDNNFSNKKEIESMRNQNGYLSKLLKISHDKKIIDDDDFSLCKYILLNRNKAQHEGANDKVSKDWRPLIETFMNKICN